MKGTIPLDAIDAAALADYAGIAAPARQGARPHQRRLDDRGLRRRLGQARRGDGRFARAYADQTEADHAALVAAVDRGVLPADPDH